MTTVRAATYGALAGVALPLAAFAAVGVWGALTRGGAR